MSPGAAGAVFKGQMHRRRNGAPHSIGCHSASQPGHFREGVGRRNADDEEYWEGEGEACGGVNKSIKSQQTAGLYEYLGCAAWTLQLAYVNAQKNEPVPGGANINDRYDCVLESSLRFGFITLRNFVQSDLLSEYPGAGEKRRVSELTLFICSCCRLV